MVSEAAGAIASRPGRRDADGPPVTPVYVLGEVVFTVGLVLLLFVAYVVLTGSWAVDRAQHDLDKRLDRLWAAGGVPVPGQPASRLYIPRLHKKWTVIEGVTQADLAKGPGHYPKTDEPGDLGNVGIAGHRLPSVFWNLDRLRRGDPIVVESRSGWFVYRVVRLRVVRPNQVEVIAHDPDHPHEKPTRKLLTLTTCNPKFNNYQRLVVVAELSREQSKKAGRPAELSSFHRS